MLIPTNLKYSTDHEWVKAEGEKATIGITDFAQHNLGDIVFVEIPEMDAEVSSGDAIAVVESVKAVSSVYSPVSGTIIEINDSLEDSPELLNQEPYEQFLAVVEMSNPSELDDLMTAEEYERFCKEQEQG